MTTPNSNNWPEAIENEKKESKISNKQEFIKAYIEKNTKNNNSNEEHVFLDDIFNDVSFFEDMESFLNANKATYEWVNVNEINNTDLKLNASLKYNNLKRKRENLNSIFLREFNISKQGDKDALEKKINSLTIKELNDYSKEAVRDCDRDKLDVLVKSNKKRTEFLNNLFWEKIPERKKKINFKNIFNIKHLSTSEKDKLFDDEPDLLANLQYLDHRSPYDALTTTDAWYFIDLLKSESIWESKKKEIIISYMPQISYKDAIKIWFIDNSDKLKLKKEIIKDLKIDLPEDEILSSISDEDLNNTYFDTAKHLESNNISTLLTKSGAKDFLNWFWYKYILESNLDLKDSLEKINTDVVKFKKEFSELTNVIWWNEFKKDAYLIVNKKLSSDSAKKKNPMWKTEEEVPTEEITYLKVISDWEKDGILKFYDLWTWEFYENSFNKLSFEFKNFLWFIQIWQKESNNKKDSIYSNSWIERIVSCEILTQEEINKRVNLKIIKKWYDTSSLLSKEEQLDNLTYDLRNQLRCDLEAKDYSNSDIKNKLEDFDRLTKTKERKKIELRGSWKTEDEINEELKNYNVFEELRDIKKKELWDDSPRLYEYEQLIDLHNDINYIKSFSYDDLTNKLKEIIGSELWKYEFHEWTTFYSRKWDLNSFFTINKIDKVNNTITLDNNDKEIISFSDFYNEFKKQDCALSSDAKNFNELLSGISKEKDDVNKWWDGFKFNESSWTILKKKTNQKDSTDGTNINYDYLVSEKWESKFLIKIHSISWDKVKISEWEYKEHWFSKDEEDKNGDLKNKIKTKEFAVSDKIVTISIWELYSFIVKDKLKPRALDEEKDVIEDDVPDPGVKPSFISRFFDRYSIKDILAWWKLWIESIEAYLKESEEEHAAKFANGLFGKFLPPELQSDLKTRVESAQKKRQDDYIQKLKDVDSSDATIMITKWLKNKNTPEYKKEAWLIFMLEKYWTLYTKKLIWEKWSFLWYESMWWKIGDKLYMEEKEKAEKNDVPFTEEQLMYILLILQCRWDLSPKRRSRLHKDFNRFRNQWKEEEFKTWEIDAKARRTPQWRNEYVFWELDGWTYPNARWWYHRLIEKWWSIELLNEVPFVMLFSWVASWYEEAELDKWKDLIVEWKLIPIAQFLWNISKINLFNDTVLEISKIISEEDWGKFPNMLRDAKEIFWKQKTVEWDKKKINRTRKFYEEYWKPLSSSLNMLHDKDSSENSKYSDLVIIHKENNQVLNDYFVTVHGWNDYNFAVEEFMTDAFIHQWTSWMDMEKATIDVLALASWPTLRQKNIAKSLWPEIVNGFNAKANRKYHNDDKKDDEYRKKAIKHQLKGLIVWFLKNAWADQGFIDAYNQDTFLFSRMNDWWVYLSEVKRKWISLENVEKLEWGSNELMDKWVQQIIDYEAKWLSSKKWNDSKVVNIKSQIQWDVDSYLWDYEKVA